MFIQPKMKIDVNPWVFPEIPRVFRTVFYEHCTLKTIRKGDKINFNSGSIENNKKFFILLNKGVLLNYREINATNKELFTGVVLPNRVAGHNNFLNLTDNSEFLIASVDSEVMFLSVDNLKAAFLQTKDLKDCVYQYCISCLKSESEGAHIIGTKNVDQRVRLLFHSLMNAYPKDENNDTYKIPLKLTNEEIRKVIFATRKTINTLIPKWKRSNLYQLDKNSTIINKKLIIFNKFL
ncbi:hypothetical protein L2737_14605 [Shewanella electrodiphila]|uniref:Crp/Fnr family transcriptional regulator n=1 Tax=Shewanella electrodiphila TaxID=934143 RepID=A0ABT0KRQ9_9GAMM|nr:hypothetical protein [Shewanella electrodiphila]MCL1046542.1 hypothetical protein [Shewanella electrodiphila]